MLKRWALHYETFQSSKGNRMGENFWGTEETRFIMEQVRQRVETKKAVTDLTTLANTTKDESERLEKNTETTYRCLRDLVKLAKNAHTDKTDITRNLHLQCWIVTALILFLAVAAKAFLI